MSLFSRIGHKIKKAKSKKKSKFELHQPAPHRSGDLEYTGALRPAEKKEKKEWQPVFDVTYFVKAVTQVFAALFAICIMLYFGYHMVMQFTSDVTTIPVRTMSETEYRDATGYIIRSETPLRASADGYADYSVEDGERVAKGETVCTLYDSVSADIKQQISQLDEKIEILEKSLVSETVPRGILEVSSDVSDDYDVLMQAIASGKYRQALDISDDFCADLGRLKVLSKDSSGFYERYRELLSERRQLLASLGSPTGSVTASSAGYFFYECDGYETVFTEKLVKEFTESNFNAAVSSASSGTSGTFGKIAGDSEWYLACVCEGTDMAFLECGEKCNIVFEDNSDITIAMTLEKKIRTETGMLMLFSSSEMLSGFNYLREQRVKLEFRVYDGYRVPVSAVHSYEGMTGVFALNGGYVNFRKINILSEGEGYYIVSAYEDIETGMPATYRVFPYGERGTIDDYASLHSLCEKLGFEREIYDKIGIRLKFGENYVYYYYLSDKESIITSGDGLYHGKVMG